MKLVSQNKGNGDIGGGIGDEGWEPRYEFTGTKPEQFPLPVRLPLPAGRRLDALAQQLSATSPEAVAADAVPSQEHLAEAHERWTHLDAERATVAVLDRTTTPGLDLGERAFEIVVAREMAAGHAETQWFARHRSTPITELPAHWPDDYRRLVEARIELIGRRRDLALIERPECKRRWATEPWDKQQERALRTWLLDRCEARHLWFAPDADGDEQPAVPVDVIVPDPTGPASARAVSTTDPAPLVGAPSPMIWRHFRQGAGGLGPMEGIVAGEGVVGPTGR